MSNIDVRVLANLRTRSARGLPIKKYLNVVVNSVNSKNIDDQVQQAMIPEGYVIKDYEVVEKQYCLDFGKMR